MNFDLVFTAQLAVLSDWYHYPVFRGHFYTFCRAFELGAKNTTVKVKTTRSGRGLDGSQGAMTPTPPTPPPLTSEPTLNQLLFLREATVLIKKKRWIGG